MQLFKNVITAGRLKCCAMEDPMVVAHGCRKTKRLICGMEENNVVAYGCLLSPPRLAEPNLDSSFTPKNTLHTA